jgi:16S rRNA (cytosine1402-N4)-methyltransferase
MDFHHVSVLYKETIKGLNIKENGIYVDATLGGGGHTLGIFDSSSNVQVIGIDQDEEAIEASKNRLYKYENNILFIKDNFKNIKQILKENNIDFIDGAVIDLGVSSHQIDTVSRGFTYQKDAPLDMRMDKNKDFSALNIINEYKEEDLIKIFHKYGEEKFAKRIAGNIVKSRSKKSIKTTGELVDIIKRSIPASYMRDGHPGKRVFQAIRIEVNNELEIIDNALLDFIDVLRSGGRMAVITFHSLEDRIVKKTFNEAAKGCTCPPEFPICVCNKKPVVKLVNKKPIVPNENEIKNNPRSRSSKLRIIEKI